MTPDEQLRAYQKARCQWCRKGRRRLVGNECIYHQVGPFDQRCTFPTPAEAFAEVRTELLGLMRVIAEATGYPSVETAQDAANAVKRAREYQSVLRELLGEREQISRLQIANEGLEYRLLEFEDLLGSRFKNCHSINDAYNLYDGMQGRALAAEERVKALEAVERRWKAMVENGWWVEQSPWPEDDELSRAEICTTCGGTPHPSGLVCICGGTGSRSAETQGLREYILKLENANAAAFARGAEAMRRAAVEVCARRDNSCARIIGALPLPEDKP